jgi:hypothetical protein
MADPIFFNRYDPIVGRAERYRMTLGAKITRDPNKLGYIISLDKKHSFVIKRNGSTSFKWSIFVRKISDELADELIRR